MGGREFGNTQCNKRETSLSWTSGGHFQFVLKTSWSWAWVSRMGSELVISGQMPASGENFTKGVRVPIWICFTLSLLQTECCSELRNFPIWGFGLESSLLWAINIFKIPENFLPGHLKNVSLFGMKERWCSVGVCQLHFHSLFLYLKCIFACNLIQRFLWKKRKPSFFPPHYFVIFRSRL